MAEKIACLEILATAATLKGEPTTKEFEAFLVALSTFQPLPPEVTPEKLLSHPPALETRLPQVQTPALQQQVYRGAYRITHHSALMGITALMGREGNVRRLAHVGEDWSFLSQSGDMLANHIVDTYRRAVEAETETNQTRNFPISDTR